MNLLMVWMRYVKEQILGSVIVSDCTHRLPNSHSRGVSGTCLTGCVTSDIRPETRMKRCEGPKYHGYGNSFVKKMQMLHSSSQNPSLKVLSEKTILYVTTLNHDRVSFCGYRETGILHRAHHPTAHRDANAMYHRGGTVDSAAMQLRQDDTTTRAFPACEYPPRRENLTVPLPALHPI